MGGFIGLSKILKKVLKYPNKKVKHYKKSKVTTKSIEY